MKTTTTTCDIQNCGEIISIHSVDIQVIFTTEQTEGRFCGPYLSIEELDICPQCLDKVLAGNYIWANGAQGHNTYYFKK